MPSELERQLLVAAAEKDEELRLLRKELAELKATKSHARPQSASAARSHSPTAPTSSILPKFDVELLDTTRHGVSPPGFEGHSSVGVDGRVYVFGGRNGSNIFGETWSLNVANARWSRVPVSGSVPWGRYGHSAVVFKGSMFVFGGFGPGGSRVGASTDDHSQGGQNLRGNTGLLGSFFALDLQTKGWSELSAQGEPSKSHSAVVHGNTMYLFGGCVARGRTNAVRAFDFQDQKWLPTETFNPQLVAQPPTAGNASLLARSDIPAARSGHCAGVQFARTAGTPASMVIFGGRLSKYCFANDSFQYNLESKRWARMYCGGTIPSARSDHSGSVYKENLIVVGGYALEQAGSPSETDDAASLGRKTFFNDVCVLNLISCTWTRVELSGPQRPIGICGHSATLFDSCDGRISLLIQGGFGCIPSDAAVLHDDDVARLGQMAGDADYAATSSAWAVAIANAPQVGPPPRRPERPQTARGRMTPRQRPLSARSASARRSASPRGPKSFSVQTCNATTAKTFGDPEYKPAPPVRRSQYEIDQINKRLAYDDVQRAEKKREELRQRFLRESEPRRMTSDEQSESVDRLYYQQNEWRQEKAKQLEEKWVRVQPPKRVDWEIVQDTVARLTIVPEPREPTPIERRAASPAQVKSSIDRLYYEARRESERHHKELQSKLWGNAAAKKLRPADMSDLVNRLCTTSGSPAVPRQQVVGADVRMEK
eukprot:CAMPEP_0174831950 /NCGR_PEP_ID=MMETSP1114-20130205/3396_1 /TAXON_ID=312471 /ORGANISM="Neobodo designis, Strain CCAP 1951/1" /LENGTH=712 /DNA_ID=CAMNT_0016065797 /DNA_START=30 /DNA_END=2166 /DNA_ORIENTATION=-